MIYFNKKGLRVYYQSTIKEEISILEKSLSIYVEGSEYSNMVREGKWDGYAKYFDKGKFCFWYGLMSHVEQKLNKRQIKYKKEGFNYNSLEWVEFSDKVSADNRDYQRNAILEFLKVGNGIILVPTRGGKTFIASELIRLLIGSTRASSVLFITDNVDLFAQAIKDISSYLGLKEGDIGKIRGDKFVIKQITVGMIQTIQSILYGKKNNLSKQKRVKRNQLEKYLKSVEFPIVDEIHEYGASSRRIAILRKFSSYKYYLGLSATPYKLNKIANMNIDSVTGGIIYNISERDLTERKVLADSKILLLLFEHDSSILSNEHTYSQVKLQFIIKNPKRNSLIAHILSLCDYLGLKTISMFQSIEHGKHISDITGYRFISSDADSEERIKAKEDLLSKSGGILLVSDIWKKGITLPGVEVLINVSGGKEASLFLQRRGRILGVTSTKKKALYIDFIDDCSYYLGEHGLLRIEAYEKQAGKKNIDVLDVSSIEIHKDIRDYLIEFFELNIQE